jgi:hypothetical protein
MKMKTKMKMKIKFLALVLKGILMFFWMTMLFGYRKEEL